MVQDSKKSEKYSLTYAPIYCGILLISYMNPVAFICDGTRPQKCYQIKRMNISSEYNLYNMKPS